MMYIGSASLVMPFVQKAREDHNSVMGACAMGAGVILSIGLGNFASKLLNQTIDKAVEFWDDVKPKEPKPKEPKAYANQNTPDEEESENG